MKKLLKFLTLFIVTGSLKAQTTNFTVTSSTGSFSITCAQTSLTLTASTLVNPPVSFHWLSATSSFTGSTLVVTQPTTYTVTVLDSLNVVFGTQYITISSNTLAPSSVVSPASQNISCGATTGATVTSNASGNVSHTFLSPYGGSVFINSPVATYTSLGPGTYTHILVNNANGCQSSSTFTLASSQGFPTFSVTSPQNFTLGCNSTSVTTIFIMNAGTTPTPGGAVSYTIVSVSTASLPSTGPISPNTTYSVNTAGLYYVVVRDNSNNCSTQIPITVLSNTIAPNLSVTVPNQILSCDSAQVLLHAYTTTTNTSINWNFIGTPSLTVGSTVLANSSPVSPTQTLVNTYTLVITDLNNACKSTSVIPVYQNLFPPKAVISPASSTLTCLTPTVVLTNLSSTGIPPGTGFPSNKPVIGYLWEGPGPQIPLPLSSTYTAGVVGVYTLTVKDLNNGCLSQTTTVVSDNRIYPSIVPPTGAIILLCPGLATINAVVNGLSTNTSYSWSNPPGAIVTGNSSTTLTTNTPGDYTLTVTNILSSCSSTEVYHVYACVGLATNSALGNIQLFPNPTNGVFTITSEGLQKTTSIEIYNSIGVLVKKQILNSDKTILNMEGEAAGIYIIRLMQNNAVVHTSKIVKE